MIMMSVMVIIIIIIIITIVILVTNISILNDKGAFSQTVIPCGDTTNGGVRNPKINPILSHLYLLKAPTFNFYSTFEYYNTLYVLVSQLFL